MKTKEKKICPKCKSTDIGFNYNGTTTHDYCRSCGFNNLGIEGFAIFPIKIDKK